jgi:hypothetical protein
MFLFSDPIDSHELVGMLSLGIRWCSLILLIGLVDDLKVRSNAGFI